MRTPSKHSRVVLVPTTLLALSLSGLCASAGQAQSPQLASNEVEAAAPPQQASQPAPTLAANIDRQVSRVEKLIVDVAEAMPEDKFNFNPEGLRIAGSDYKGVLTFAGQIKHVAAGNYFIWSKVAGEKLDEKLFNDGRGPDNLKTKAEIIQFVKNSFALAHNKAATLTPENMLQSAGTSTRINMAIFSVSEAYNHYGQMVEYLRMNGIVPPASRAKSD
jgi:hypothetical protein